MVRRYPASKAKQGPGKVEEEEAGLSPDVGLVINDVGREVLVEGVRIRCCHLVT